MKIRKHIKEYIFNLLQGHRANTNEITVRLLKREFQQIGAEKEPENVSSRNGMERKRRIS